MTTPTQSANVPMGTIVVQSDSSQVSDGSGTTTASLIKPIVSSSSVPQVLIVRKTTGMPTLVQTPTVAVSQLITSTSETPKIVNVPFVGIQNSAKMLHSDNASHLTVTKNPAGVKVVWPSNLTPGLLPMKQNAGNVLQNTQPIAVKRTVPPSIGNQVVTKVIITNNPSSNQSITPIPISVNTSATGSSVVTPQSLLLSSPTKAITLSRNIVNVTSAQQMLKTTPGTPTKQGVYLLSPVKPLPKITTVQPSLIKSPRRIAPATSGFSSMVSTKLVTVAGSVATTSTAITKTVTIQPSPKKILLKTVSGNLPSVLASTPITPSQMQTAGIPTQQLQIPGNNFHFVRLVSAPNSTTTNTVIPSKQASILPVTTATSVVSSLPTITVTSQMYKGATAAKQAVKIKPAQKLIIPAPTTQGGSTSVTVSSAQISQLTSGATYIPIGNSPQGYVVLPANYVTQIQPAAQPSVQNASVMIQNILPAPIITTSNATVSGVSPTGIDTLAGNVSNNLFLSSASNQSIPQPKYINGRVSAETVDSRPRKPCNCTKSQCLKLYCDCFASGEFCNGCNCNNCYNNLTHEEERQKAIKACLERNRMAFHPKIGKSREGDTERRHTKGCHCKRSGCLKNYCECYEAKILCTDLCKCIGCKNFEDSFERKTLMHLADAAEVRVQQQAAAITNFTSDIFDGLSRHQPHSGLGGALPISFINDEVIEATVSCLLARAHHAERQRKSEAETEKVLLEEFGLCLMSIISRSNQVEDVCSDVDSNS